MWVDIEKLATMYRNAGLDVEILPGAHTRAARLFASSGYPAGGPRFSDKHHTAQSIATWDSSSINYLAGISHPQSWVMANVYPHKRTPNLITIIAAGPTYTAGKGGPLGNVPQDQGNLCGWSWEMPNNGVGEPWPDHLCDTAVTGAAVEMEFFQWAATKERFCSHFEWAPGRKIDPWGPSKFNGQRNTYWDMDLFRTHVHNRHHDLYNQPEPPPIDPPEDEAMLTRFTTTNRDGQFLIGAGTPILLSSALVAERYHAVPKVVGHGSAEDARWDSYNRIWEAAQR